jgi:hypothetical protein
MRGDRPVAVLGVAAWHQQRSDQPACEPEGEAEAHVLQDEVPPHKMFVVCFQGGGERQHCWQRKAVVEAGLEVQRVTDHPGYAGVGDHPGGQDRVGGGEQRAQQERLRPAQPHQRACQQRDDDRGDRHPDRQLAQWQLPVALQQLAVHLQAVAEEDHDQRHCRQIGDEAGARLEMQDADRTVTQEEPRQHEQRRE